MSGFSNLIITVAYVVVSFKSVIKRYLHPLKSCWYVIVGIVGPAKETNISVRQTVSIRLVMAGQVISFCSVIVTVSHVCTRPDRVCRITGW